jgi:hypothetical protein
LGDLICDSDLHIVAMREGFLYYHGIKVDEYVSLERIL